MSPSPSSAFPPRPAELETDSGRFPLYEYRLRLAAREWSVLHTGEVLTIWDEQRFLGERETGPPYGVVLWPAAIALAHDLAGRADALRGQRVLELGAGTGLPGIVAASLGAEVVQTDRHELAMTICRQNGARNGVTISYRTADWTAWDDTQRYPWIIGADVLYGEATQPHLREIFTRNLAPDGRILLADPFRKSSLRLLESLQDDGWQIRFSKWNVEADADDEDGTRAIGVFELAPPSVDRRS